MPSDGFVVPDWNAPLDVDTYVAGIPPSACIKGVFPAAVVEAARAKKVILAGARPKYHPFSDVPLREYIPMLVAAGAGMFPDLPPRQGLRKLGRASRDAIEKSMFGRILMTNFLDMRSSLSLMGKVAAIATPGAKFVVEDVSEGYARLSFANVYTFADSHHVGIFEKLASSSSKLHVEASVKLRTLYEGQMELAW
jgi:uncharacterized protein (TIGR02265 family)